MKKITEEQLIAGLAEEFVGELEQKLQAQKDTAIQENLDSTLDEFGITDETKTKATALFYKAVENKDSSLRFGIANLLGIYAPILEGSDVIDILSDRIQELEDAIAEVESENELLSSEITARLSESYGVDGQTITQLWQNSESLEDLEQNIHRHQFNDRPVKRSIIDDQLSGGLSYSLDGSINETDSFTQDETYIPENMKQYMKFFRSKIW